MPTGECVEKCLSDLFEIDGFKCVPECPGSYSTLEIPGKSKKCVKVCPAGYKKESGSSFSGPGKCVRCKVEKCPRGMFTPKNLMMY